MEKNKRFIETTSSEDLMTQRNRAITIASKHKAREERIYRGLKRIAEAIGQDDLAQASRALDALLGTDLKDARQEVEDHDIALKLSVHVLRTHPDAMTRGSAACKALGAVRQLVPEAFDAAESASDQAAA